MTAFSMRSLAVMSRDPPPMRGLTMRARPGGQLRTTMATRRFWARPSGVSFVATGSDGP